MNRLTQPSERHSRRGNIIVLTLLLMTALLFMLAVAIDIGFLCVVRTEAQRTADCAALAGAGAMYTPIDSVELREYVPPFEIELARQTAQSYGGMNGAGRYMATRSGDRLHVDLNIANKESGDIVLGRLNGAQLTVSESNPNAVHVEVRLTDSHQNGAVTTFLGRFFDANFVDSLASATASVVNYPVIMPITTSVTHFEAAGSGDEFSFVNGQVLEEPDGIPEIAIYPGKWNGVDLPPGNFGALQIGPDSGTTVLRGQIDAGPTQSDFDYHGGSLHEGVELGGKTGVSADIETSFVGGRADGNVYEGILGKTRFMPLYSNVTGNGNNATFTIVRFVAVRIMEASLKSGTKRVVVQAIDDPAELATAVRLRR